MAEYAETLPTFVPPALPWLAPVAAAALFTFALVGGAYVFSQACIVNGNCGPIALGPGGAIDTQALAKLLQTAKGLTITAAMAAAAACTASAAAGLLVRIPGDPCSGTQLPIFFSGDDNPQTTQNILAGQTRGLPAPLTRFVGRPRTTWYNGMPACNPEARDIFAAANGGDRGVCDEYPFNSTHENKHSLPTVELRLVPRPEGPIQRDALLRFYTSECKIGDSEDFAVVPVPAGLPASLGFCPGR